MMCRTCTDSVVFRDHCFQEFMYEPFGRGVFLNLAALLEGGVVLLALLLGWFVGIEPLSGFSWEWLAVAWGVAATAPMIALFLLSHSVPVGPLKPIARFLVDTLGPPLDACRWYDLLALSFLVGFSEELLFRGVLQPWFTVLWGATVGLVASNVLFGLAHMVTPFYAVLAGLFGIYFGLLLNATGAQNLLPPMLTHALYDFVAFLVIRRTFRREMAARVASDELGDDSD